MDVIASTVFGLDVDSQSKTDHPFVEHASTLLGASKKPKGFFAICKQICLIIMLFTFPTSLRVVLANFFGLSFTDQESMKYFNNVIDRLVKERKQNPDPEVGVSLDLVRR
ncbi:hypothetical protein EB796_018456 [Bugula neritina]|uniref:Uncharacterized protein n=1 Tax=Bugula neritina TaxID=10212 RepID=A0A7J7JC55_BUGNE|nr:hypothetical protein EB796_018456 [Bugula neritina]